MNRITFYDSHNKPCYKIGDTEYANEVAERLAAYEDTGLTPEGIVNLKIKAHHDKNESRYFNSTLQGILAWGTIIISLIISGLVALIVYVNGGDKSTVLCSFAIAFIVVASLTGLFANALYKKTCEKNNK